MTVKVSDKSQQKSQKNESNMSQKDNLLSVIPLKVNKKEIQKRYPSKPAVRDRDISNEPIDINLNNTDLDAVLFPEISSEATIDHVAGRNDHHIDTHLLSPNSNISH